MRSLEMRGVIRSYGKGDRRRTVLNAGIDSAFARASSEAL